MAYEIEGAIIEIGETRSFDSGFCVRQVVIDTGGKYPQKVPVDVVKDSCEKLDHCFVGESIKLSFEVRGREWNGKYYAGLQAWRFDRLDVQGKPDATPAQQVDPPPVTPGADVEQLEEDNIPF